MATRSLKRSGYPRFTRRLGVWMLWLAIALGVAQCLAISRIAVMIWIDPISTSLQRTQALKL
ncbi:MAG: hypothetical protein ACO3S2_04605, partial [Burkholderiaceae bacterium]